MRPQQTRLKKAEANKKRSKMKIQEERKASTNLLALQEHIPTTWEHGPKNRSENRSSAVQSKPDRKKAPASEASGQRSGKNSPEETAAERREERQTSKQLPKKYFVSIHKRTSETTHKTHGHPHPATPPPPPAAKLPPPPRQRPPQKNTNRPMPNFGMSSGQGHGIQGAWKCSLQRIRE